MTTWKDALLAIGHSAEEHFDTLKLQLQQRLNLLDPIQILAYRGHGNAQDMYLKGRVLEDKGIAKATDNDSVWDNVLAMYQRFESDEIPNVRVRARLYDMAQEAVTDDEGYFELHFQPTTPLPPERLWHDVSLELLDSIVPEQGPVNATGHILVPPSSSAFGVISDVDDTILKTNATDFLKMARMTLLNNVHSRMPFAGVASFYAALQRGASGTAHNPVFYVSSSPWNLYDLLHDFLNINDIPVGPLFLRDLGLDKNKFIKSGHHTHKLGQIERLLATYPDLPFILIGDSGQKDPEIYRQVVQDFPDRILAVYIRDVTDAERDTEVLALAETIATQRGELLLVPDTLAAAVHAVERGFIAETAIDAVRADLTKDTATPSRVEQVLEH